MRVLVVEDERRLAAALQDALTDRGYRVQVASTAARALRLCGDEVPPDLVLLDLGLPDHDGMQLCAALRRRAAIIVVTGRADVPSRVQALRRGADDYLVKPFSLAELLARIEAVLRRARRHEPGRDAVLEVGELQLDLAARRARVAGKPVEFTREEFDLLAALVRAQGATVDRQRLLVEVWGHDWVGRSRTLDVHVATLRAKLGGAFVVETVRGVGYRLGEPAG